MHTNVYKPAVRLFLTALCVAVGANWGLSQATGVVSPVDTFAVIVPARTIDEIKADLDATDGVRARAKTRLENAKEQVRKTESDIATKKKEIDVLESRMDAADKEKKDTVVAAFKVQISGVENLRDLLKRRLDTRSAEVDAAEGVVDYTDVAGSLFEKEMSLAKKRQERASVTASGGLPAALANLDKEIREQELSVLDAQVDRLKKQEKSLSLERDLVKQQMKLAEAQAKLLEK